MSAFAIRLADSNGSANPFSPVRPKARACWISCLSCLSLFIGVEGLARLIIITPVLSSERGVTGSVGVARLPSSFHDSFPSYPLRTSCFWIINEQSYKINKWAIAKIAYLFNFCQLKRRRCARWIDVFFSFVLYARFSRVICIITIHLYFAKFRSVSGT